MIVSSDNRSPSGSSDPRFASTTRVRKSPRFRRYSLGGLSSSSSLFLFSICCLTNRLITSRACANRRDCSSGWTDVFSSGLHKIGTRSSPESSRQGRRNVAWGRPTCASPTAIRGDELRRAHWVRSLVRVFPSYDRTLSGSSARVTLLVAGLLTGLPNCIKCHPVHPVVYVDPGNAAVLRDFQR